MGAPVRQGRRQICFLPRVPSNPVTSLLMSSPLPAEAVCESRERVVLAAVGLYCVTIPWLQTRKVSLYITVGGVLLHETVERTHLGR